MPLMFYNLINIIKVIGNGERSLSPVLRSLTSTANIYCGYSKEPSQQDSSLRLFSEYPKTSVNTDGSKTILVLC